MPPSAGSMLRTNGTNRKRPIPLSSTQNSRFRVDSIRGIPLASSQPVIRRNQRGGKHGRNSATTPRYLILISETKSAPSMHLFHTMNLFAYPHTKNNLKQPSVFPLTFNMLPQISMFLAPWHDLCHSYRAETNTKGKTNRSWERMTASFAGPTGRSNR